MNKTTIRIIVSLIITLLFIPSLVAQDKEKKATPYWYVTSVKMDYVKLDSLAKIYKEYLAPISKAAIKEGTILDYKLLFHHTGEEHMVLIMTKHPSWCAIEKGWMSATYKAIEPNEEIRKVFWDALDYLYEGSPHTDNIYYEQ